MVPETAWAVINHRVHPAQSLQEVLEYDKATIADDQVEVRHHSIILAILASLMFLGRFITFMIKTFRQVYYFYS